MEDDRPSAPFPSAPSQPAQAEPSLPASVPFVGLAIALSAWLPITPEGNSFARLVLDEFSRGALFGVLMVAGFGSPFVFGLAVFVGSLLQSSEVARRLVRVPISLMHSQLVLVAVVIWRHGEAVAPVALLGFAVVSAVYLAYYSAQTFASADGPGFRWYVRWGAMVIVGISLWAELQRVRGVALDIGLHMLLGCGLLMSLMLAPPRRSQAVIVDPPA